MFDFRRMVRERLRDSGLSPVREAEIVDEVSQHLHDRYASLLAGGVSSEEAHGRVLAELEDRDLANALRSIEQQWNQAVTLGFEGESWSCPKPTLLGSCHRS